MDRTEQIFRDYLSRKGLQLTKERRAVFLAFLTFNGHASAEEIYDIVRQAGIKVGIAAVWRTMRLILKAGLAEEHYFGKSAIRYEQKKEPESHGHIVCHNCGRAEEFDLTEILPVINRIGSRHRHEVDGYELSIFGTCRSCRERVNTDPADSVEYRNENRS